MQKLTNSELIEAIELKESDIRLDTAELEQLKNEQYERLELEEINSKIKFWV